MIKYDSLNPTNLGRNKVFSRHKRKEKGVRMFWKSRPVCSHSALNSSWLGLQQSKA